MPQPAKIFLVEDDESIRNNVRYFLEKAGHEIVVEATSLDEALVLIPGLSQREVNVAIVDGNLTSGSSGSDGQTIARAIREQAQGIKVVAYSSQRYDYGDIFIPKAFTVEAMRKFAETISAL